MIVNPDKFQVIIINKRRENQITQKLKIYNNGIETTKSLKLLVIEIYIQLSFIQNKSNLCFKAIMHLNAICRLAKVMGDKEKIAIINSFICSNFNYCPLVLHFWHFISGNLRKM